MGTSIRRGSSLRIQFKDTITEADIENALKILGMTAKDIRCVYCGNKATTWDHFYGLVKDKEPRIRSSSIYNFVPCCHRCNFTRGTESWEEWIDALKSRGAWWGIQKTENKRLARLRKYQNKSRRIKDLSPTKVFKKDTWNQYKNICERVIKLLKEADTVASKLDQQLEQWILRSAL